MTPEARLIILCILLFILILRFIWFIIHYFSPVGAQIRLIHTYYNKLFHWQQGIDSEAQAYGFIQTIENIVKNDECSPGLCSLYCSILTMEHQPWYDYKKALTFLEMKAEKGIPECQFLLGKYLHQGGKNIPPDNVTANYWLKKARENGISED